MGRNAHPNDNNTIGDGRRALIALTSHDRVTRVMSSACDEIHSVFAEAALDVTILQGGDVTIDRVYTLLREAASAGTPFCIGFFSGHGCKDGICGSGMNWKTSLVVDLECCRLLRHANVSLLSCLGDGTFAENAVSLSGNINSKPVVCVIGYKGELRVGSIGIKGELKKNIMSGLRLVMRAHALACLDLDPDKSGVKKIQDSWIQAIYGLASQDREFGLSWLENRRALQAWK